MPEKLLRHVVMFAFNQGTDPEQIHRIEAAFAALPGQIPAIHSFEWGVDVSIEGRAHGFTHCFVVTFRSEEDRNAYLPHPAHKAFGELLHPHLADVLVVDYWTGDSVN
jgi:hypothetical protein